MTALLSAELVLGPLASFALYIYLRRPRRASQRPPLSVPYSTLIFAGAVGAGATIVAYTVPQGQVLIIRDIEVTGAGASGASFQGGTGGTANTIFWSVPFGSSVVWAQWQGRLVLPYGYTVALRSTGSVAYSCVVSGYLLSAN